MGQSATLNSYEGSGEFYINNRIQAEADSVKVAAASGDNAITTFGHGFAGFADGPGTVSIEFSAAARKLGYETDFELAVHGKIDVTIVVKNGGYRRNYIGRITSSDYSASATDKSSISGSFTGKFIGVS